MVLRLQREAANGLLRCWHSKHLSGQTIGGGEAPRTCAAPLLAFELADPTYIALIGMACGGYSGGGEGRGILC